MHQGEGGGSVIGQEKKKQWNNQPRAFHKQMVQSTRKFFLPIIFIDVM